MWIRKWWVTDCHWRCTLFSSILVWSVTAKCKIRMKVPQIFVTQYCILIKLVFRIVMVHDRLVCLSLSTRCGLIVCSQYWPNYGWHNSISLHALLRLRIICEKIDMERSVRTLFLQENYVAMAMPVIPMLNASVRMTVVQRTNMVALYMGKFAHSIPWLTGLAKR